MTRESPATESLTIGVLVSSYNYAEYVVEAVNSALAQSRAPDQIVVVDDGSSDNSVDVLQAAFGSTAGVTLLTKENGGQLSAWQHGLSHLQTDLVAFLDSDDRWSSGYLQSVEAVFRRESGVGFVYCDMAYFGSREGPMIGDGRDRHLGHSVLLGAFIHTWQGTATSALALRLDDAVRILDLPESMRQDWRARPDDCLVYGADILGIQKYYLGDTLVDHRAHSRNALLSYGSSAKRKYDYLRASERMLEHYRQRAGITTHWLRLAKQEFRTKQRPSWKETRAYCWMAWRAPLPISKRLEQLGGIVSHFMQCLLRRR